MENNELNNIQQENNEQENIQQENIQNEQWFDFPDYEGLYQISSEGRVRSVDRPVGKGMRKGKVLKKRKQYNKTYIQLIKDRKYRAFNNIQLNEIVQGLMSANNEVGNTMNNTMDNESTDTHVEE